jgi:hypothetical protein
MKRSFDNYSASSKTQQISGYNKILQVNYQTRFRSQFHQQGESRIPVGLIGISIYISNVTFSEIHDLPSNETLSGVHLSAKAKDQSTYFEHHIDLKLDTNLVEIISDDWSP